MRTNRNKLRVLTVFFFFLVFFLSGCQPTVTTAGDPVNETPPPPPKQNKTLIISVTGDIMMHNTQLQAGYQPKLDNYDYSPFFKRISPLLKVPDLLIGNLETTFAGKSAGYGGYPRFNTPEEMAADLKGAGFDILTTANNHSLDKGFAGLASTLDNLDAACLLHTGTSRTIEEQGQLLLLDIQDIKLAVLSYTYGTNGLTPPKDKEYCVNYINEDAIKADILKAQEQGAGYIIVCLHFGQEYQTKPNSHQKQLAQSLFAAGADIIFGSHPHVLQPTAVIKNENRDTNNFVIYSLGNFISDQSKLERKSSVLLNVFLTIEAETNKVSFEKATYIPIWTRRYQTGGRTSFEVLPIEPCLTSIETGQEHDFSNKEIETLNQAWELIDSRLSGEHSDMFMLHRLPLPVSQLDLIESYRQ